MKFYMFRAVPLPIIRSLFTAHSAMVYVIQFCRQLLSRTRMELHEFHPDPARKLYDIHHCRVTENKLLMMGRGTCPKHV